MNADNFASELSGVLRMYYTKDIAVNSDSTLLIDVFL